MSIKSHLKVNSITNLTITFNSKGIFSITFNSKGIFSIISKLLMFQYTIHKQSFRSERIINVTIIGDIEKYRGYQV